MIALVLIIKPVQRLMSFFFFFLLQLRIVEKVEVVPCLQLHHKIYIMCKDFIFFNMNSFAFPLLVWLIVICYGLCK